MSSSHTIPATGGSAASSGNTTAKPRGRIFIAHDQPDVRECLCRLLSGSFSVETASTGAEALERMARSCLPDVVLTDVTRPAVDGFELLRRIRADDRTRTLPVILLGARSGVAASLDGWRAGADDYLVRPFTAQELVARLQRRIELAAVRRAAEQAVRSAEEHLRLAVDSTGLGTWEHNPVTGQLTWSARSKAMWGLAPDAAVDYQKFLGALHPEDRDRVTRDYEASLRPGGSGEYQDEYRIVWPDGTVRRLLTRGKTIFADTRGHNEVVRVVGTVLDITEREHVEESYRQTQKLESLGLLAGGIAHDFNNLLAGINVNAGLLAEGSPAGSDQARAAGSLLSAADRMAKLTAQMLTYSGRGRLVVEAVNLSRQVSQITSLIRAAIPKNVEIRLELDDPLPPIEADTGQLQQVIMNLVINGAEAIGSNRGAVEIHCGVLPVTDSNVRANPTRQVVSPEEYIVLTVRDSGCGMDDATKRRIFDPFFTTKVAGRGLGLSAVLGIVRSHQGILTVDSRPGEGTTFRVHFPIAQKAEPSRKPVKRAPAHGRGTVLVVDDEEMLRTSIKAFLSRSGYRVMTAADGQEAVSLYASMAHQIDLVLLDMTMPVMDGIETLQRLTEIRPDVVVLGTSGYSEIEAEERFGAHLSGFLQKPYTVSQLRVKVAGSLQRYRQAS